MQHAAQGPLTGLRIVEISGLGPTPFTAQLFADMGAEVIRIARPNSAGAENHVLGMENDPLDRGRDVLELDLKNPGHHAIARRLILRADALIEGMRPGAMERLGLGPEDFPENPALVYGRMTGWGQNGPLAHTAGHDINYVALSGALGAIGTPETPVVPLNLVGDFGGGTLYLAFGMMAALWHARTTGQGQVVDAAITDGVASLLGMIHGMAGNGLWSDRRGESMLDGAIPWYGVYACADGQHLAIGPLEPKFWAEFQRLAGFAEGELPDRARRDLWPELRRALTERIASKTRDEWAVIFEGSDACATPVLTLSEATRHPHNVARRAYLEHEGMVQPAPAPKLSLTPGAIGPGSSRNRIPPEEALSRWQA
ncbi:CoA transferase [Sinirhodobacter sp. WL0062]|uniref:CoA transferase n=1 Tax=Rhodobacter flavimaris TaxID=2907145 RepID=A0ABS8YWN1_9RHOB|nr:CaiB/BaiF CoA-transferase family protein [Sinirhodobacter sp. WL0062]MCE5972948.1 CoA transferase [Sinirhodobacter sp. WL0062]